MNIGSFLLSFKFLNFIYLRTDINDFRSIPVTILMKLKQKLVLYRIGIFRLKEVWLFVDMRRKLKKKVLLSGTEYWIEPVSDTTGHDLGIQIFFFSS